MITASEIMSKNVTTIGPDSSISAAMDLLLEKGVSGLPVVDGEGHLVGILTEFALLAIAYDAKVCSDTVLDHMTTDVLTVDAHEPVHKVADLCIVHRVRRVPVMENGRLVGLIARRDVLKALHAEQLAAGVA